MYTPELAGCYSLVDVQIIKLLWCYSDLCSNGSQYVFIKVYLSNVLGTISPFSVQGRNLVVWIQVTLIFFGIDFYINMGIFLHQYLGLLFIWVFNPPVTPIAFQEGKYKRAILQYKKIVSWLEHESGLSDAEETKSKSLRLAAHLNLAMCHLKLKEYSQALENCDKVNGSLEVIPSW